MPNDKRQWTFMLLVAIVYASGISVLRALDRQGVFETIAFTVIVFASFGFAYMRSSGSKTS